MTTSDESVTNGVGPTESHVLLTDGTIARIRPLREDDRERLVRLHEGVSDESSRRRFFSVNRSSGRAYVQHLLDPDATALVLVAELHGGLVGIATAEPEATRPDHAEISFLVADEMHGRGIGTLLLEHLAASARGRRIRWFTADVLTENHPMLEVFADAGFPATRRTSEGVVSWEIATDPTEAALVAADRRERIAEQVSLRPLLYPRSVAVVGVRRSGEGIGRAVLRSIIDGDFAGDVAVVHPSATEIDGVPAHRSLASVPGHLDVVVVAVPAAGVLEVVEDAARAGASAVVVVSSGFGELGAAGTALQRAVLRTARDHDMRLLGPNCLGLLSNDPGVRLNATFGGAVPGPGNLALGSQSGGVGIVLLDVARDLGIGIRSFVSLGNQSDVSGNDLLAAWQDDPSVAAAGLYLENLGNPVRFARVARRFSQNKPLLVLLGGRSAGGARGGASHTAAAATPTVAIEALFAQTGVIACRTPAELIGTAALLDGRPLPAGRRLGIISNAGGIGILAADAADAAGLVVPELSAECQATLGEHISGTIGTGNPIDLGAGASPESVERTLDLLLRSGEVDAVLAAVVATSVSDPAPVVAAVERAAAGADRAEVDRPVLLVTMGGAHAHPVTGGPALFDSPDEAVACLANAVHYGEWLTMPRPAWVDHDEDRAAAAREVAGSLVEPGGARWLDPDDIDRLLGPYGISVLGRTATGAHDAAVAAKAIGYPVALKVADPDVVHKTDRKLVRVGLRNHHEVIRAAHDFEAELRAAEVPMLVQPLRAGVELALGIVRHPSFGPVVMVAAGGVHTNLLDDRSFLVPPLTRRDAARALRSLRIWPALDGHRGAELVDVAGLEDLVVALGHVARDLPEVVELDLNPVVATPAGASLVDVKVRLDPAGHRGWSELRRMSPEGGRS